MAKALGLLAPRPHQELEQHALVLAGRLEVAHVDGAAEVVHAHVAPDLQLDPGHGVELVLVKLVVAHHALLAAHVIDQAQGRVDLVHMVGVLAAHLQGVARIAQLSGLHAALAQQGLHAARADVDGQAVGGGNVHRHGRAQGGLAIGADAFLLGSGNKVERV